MRIRFLFYKDERVVSSDCLKLGELLDLIAKGYPGAQIVGIEVLESGSPTKQSPRLSRQKSYDYHQPVYCDQVSMA